MRTGYAALSGWVGVLSLVVATAAAAQEVAWGAPVDGVQLGVALAPGTGPLPAELTLEVLARNTTSEPRQLPVEVCGILTWTSFTRLHVRTAKGRVFRFHIGSLIDVASIHPHSPQRLAPGEVLRERFSLRQVVQRQGLEERDSALWALLRSPQQVELWTELEGSPRARFASARLKHRFALPSVAGRQKGGRCVTGIAAGGGAACALLGEGTPWCWGSYPPGQRVEVEDPDLATPQPLRPLEGGIVELGMWGEVMCGRTGSGAVYCAGGRAGYGDVMSEADGQPVRVHGLEGAARLRLGRGEQCAQGAQGVLSCWGLLSASAPAPVPPQLTAVRWEEGGPGVVQVALGNLHACALRRDGTLWCWGNGQGGLLGTGDTAAHLTPVQLTALGSEVVSVAAGASHTCAALRDGSVRCWGQSEYGALGLGTVHASFTPAPVPGLSEVVRVAAGHDRTCAWKRDGSVWCFGALLRDASPLAKVPVELKELGREVEELVFGDRHTCARTAARPGSGGGDVLCWGENTSGQLGGGKSTYTSPAVRVERLAGKTVALAAGSYFTCALTTEGAAWCWGSGSGGQLGTGRKADSPRPVRVRLPCPG